MRVSPARLALPPTIFETFPRTVRAAAAQPHGLLGQQQPPRRNMAQSNPSSNLSSEFSKYKITTTDIPTATGVSLSSGQQLLTGSLLDLFAGFPSKRKLTLWTDDASFNDPITQAEGRKQYEAQWYGLKAVFSEIERQHLLVTSAGNPVELELKTRYKLKGIGTEKVINSKVLLHTTGQDDSLRISRVEDRWDGELPDGVFAKAWRNANSVTVPAMVSVPNSVEEEESQSK